MKTIYVTLLLLFVSCNNTNKSSSEKTNLSKEIAAEVIKKEEFCSETLNKKDEVEKMLLSFYTKYITAIDEGTEQENQLRQKYLTKKLISKLKNDIEFGELDWDPLIDAQDVSSEWLKTLEIKKVDDTHYTVRFLDEFSNEFITIKLTIIKENQSYKIDDVEY